VLLSGVTVITHGWQPGSDQLPGWTIGMADAILNRADGDSSGAAHYGSIFTNSKQGEWQPLSELQRANISNRANTNAKAQEIVLLFNWAFESDMPQNGFLGAAADALFAELSAPPTAVSGLTSFIGLAPNIHFIGHSRGAVLNSLVVDRIGHYFPGTRIDQVTSLDPHPWSSPSDPGYNSASRNDSLLFTYRNVLWADNYYRQDGTGYEYDFVFNGVRADIAHNVLLDNDVLRDGGYTLSQGGEHSDTHLWYAATIDTTSTTIEGVDVTDEQQAGWWTRGVGFQESDESRSGRANIGYAYSRIGGLRGQRDNPLTHLGEMPKAPPAIFNGDFSRDQRVEGAGEVHIPGWDRHGGGGGSDIYQGHLRLSSKITHNVIYVPPWATHLTLDYRVRTSGANDGVVISFGRTNDAFISTYQNSDWVRGHAIAIPPDLIGKTTTLTLEPTDTAGGQIYSEIDIDNVSLIDGGAPVITGLSAYILPASAQPQRIKVFGSGFTANTRLFFHDGTLPYPKRPPAEVSASELSYDIKVGTDPANWRVWAVNLDRPNSPSNEKSFQVFAPPDAPAPGPIVVGGPINLHISRSVDASGNVSFTLTGTDSNLHANSTAPVLVPVSVRSGLPLIQAVDGPLSWADASVWNGSMVSIANQVTVTTTVTGPGSGEPFIRLTLPSSINSLAGGGGPTERSVSVPLTITSPDPTHHHLSRSSGSQLVVRRRRKSAVQRNGADRHDRSDESGGGRGGSDRATWRLHCGAQRLEGSWESRQRRAV
jgi:hypothetical protein